MSSRSQQYPHLNQVLRRILVPPKPAAPATTMEELDDSEGSSGDRNSFNASPQTTRVSTRSTTNRQTPRVEYFEKSNRRASNPQRRAVTVAEKVEPEDEASEPERKDFNQNSVEFEDMSTTSSSNSFTSRGCSICPHCDGSIPQDELPAHLHQHVLNQTINYARLKEIMLRQKGRIEQSSPSVSVEQEPSSSSSDSLLRTDRVDLVTHGEFPCGKCSIVFTNSFEFELHERNQHADSLYKCQHCNKSFAKLDVYEKHSKIHTGEAAHKCHLCPKTFNQRVHLRSHLRKHNGEKPYGCSYCPRSYADRSSLTYHERTHTGERPYPCPYCSRGFSKSGALKGHIVTHMRGQEDLESGQGISDEPGALQLGMQVHGNSKKIMETAFHACQYCNKTFANLSTVKIHERCHSGERPYTCSYGDCSKTFCQLAHLNTHMKTHEGLPKGPVRERRKVFVCMQCPSEFPSIGTLSEHMVLEHSGRMDDDEDFQCEYCPQKFRAEKFLQKHLTSFHKLKSHPEPYELSE